MDRVERVEAVEVLGRLCAGSVDMSRTGGRSSASVLQRVEVAGYLQALGRGPMLVAAAKYMGDECAADDLVRHQFKFVAACSLLWAGDGLEKVDMARKIAEVSVSDFVFNRCDWRRGVRFKPVKTAPGCLPVGIKRVSGVQVAAALGVSQPTYSRKWCRRYSEAVAKLQEYDQAVNRAVSRMHWQEILANA